MADRKKCAIDQWAAAKVSPCDWDDWGFDFRLRFHVSVSVTCQVVVAALT